MKLHLSNVHWPLYIYARFHVCQNPLSGVQRMLNAAYSVEVTIKTNMAYVVKQQYIFKNLRQIFNI